LKKWLLVAIIMGMVMMPMTVRAYTVGGDTYDYRYEFLSNGTIEGMPVSMNDTGLVNATPVWVGNYTDLYLYCVNSGCKTGDYTVGFGNETEANWEREDTLEGNNPTLVWNKSYATVLHGHNTSYLDSSQYGTSWTKDDSPTVGTGVFGNAIFLENGKDAIYANGESSLNSLGSQNGEMTISFWIKPSQLTNYAMIMSDCWNGDTCHLNIRQLNQAGYGCEGCIRWRIEQGDSAAKQYDSTSQLSTTAWTHVVCLANGTHVFMYFNGVMDTNAPVAYDGTIDSSGSGYFAIGTPDDKIGIEDNQYYGYLDEIRFMNYTMTDEQIKEEYYNGIIAHNLTSLGEEETPEVVIKTNTLSLSSPSDGSTNTSSTIQFDYKPILHNGNFQNCSLWTNETSWSEKEWNSSPIVNNTGNTITETFSSDDWYEWNIRCYNSTTEYFTDTDNFTVEVSSPPKYSLNSTNSTTAGESIEHRLKWEDGTGLSGYIFQFCNGTWNGTDCGSGSSFSTTIQLQDVDIENLEDTYVDETDPTKNYGSGKDLVMRANTAVLHERLRIYIKFNISPIPSGQTIDDAQLYLWRVYDHGTPYDYSLHLVYNQTWLEQNITWNDQPCGASFDDSAKCNLTAESKLTIPLGAALAWNNWTATNSLRHEYGDNEVNITFVLRADPENSTAIRVAKYVSKENTTDTTQHGYLNITYSTTGGSGWVNGTWISMTGTGNWSNVTKTINSTVGANIAWRVYTNDTSNNWNASGIFSYVTTVAADEISPKYSLNSTNSTTAGESIEHRLKWEDGTGLSGHIFSFNNGTRYWENITPSSSPPGRWTGMFICNDNELCVLFGGRGCTPNDESCHAGYGEVGYADTWLYFPNNNTWKSITSTANWWSSSDKRQFIYGCYVSSKDVAMFFGGLTNAKDTWWFNFTSLTWLNATNNSSPQPTPRAGYHIAYDSTRDLTVMYGGFKTDYSTMNDTWIFFPNNRTWKEMNANLTKSDGTCTYLPKQNYGGMVYDEVNDVMIIPHLLAPCGSQFLIYNISNNNWEAKPNGKDYYEQAGVEYFPVENITLAVAGDYGGQTKNSYYTILSNYTVTDLIYDEVHHAHGGMLTYDEVNDALYFFSGCIVNSSASGSCENVSRNLFSYSTHFVNDTWITMTGTGNWSNVTKIITNVVGTTIYWRVYANDTSNNWNASGIFSYVTTATVTNISFTINYTGYSIYSSTEAGTLMASAEFNTSQQTQSYTNASIVDHPEYQQTSLVAMINLTHIGNTDFDVNISLNESLDETKMILFGTYNNNPFSDSHKINATGWIANTSFSPNDYQEYWVWLNFTTVSVNDETQRIIYVNVTEA